MCGLCGGRIVPGADLVPKGTHDRIRVFDDDFGHVRQELFVTVEPIECFRETLLLSWVHNRMSFEVDFGLGRGDSAFLNRNVAIEDDIEGVDAVTKFPTGDSKDFGRLTLISAGVLQHP